MINPLNADLNPISHLLALLGAHHILHISRIRVKSNDYELKLLHRALISMANSTCLCDPHIFHVCGIRTVLLLKAVTCSWNQKSTTTLVLCCAFF